MPWFGRGFGWGRGWGAGWGWRGNPYPFCRWFPWLPRGWWWMGWFYYPSYGGYPGYGYMPGYPPFYPPYTGGPQKTQ